MSNVILTLGGVPFQAMEVPQKIFFGGKQRVAIQSLIGGGRVVQTLGFNQGEISFSGIFTGSDAVSRAQSLDTARILGAPLPLVWDSFFYMVVIEDFQAEYHKTNFIPFSIICVVINDPQASLGETDETAASLIGDDFNAAGALSAQAGISLAGLNTSNITGFPAVQAEMTAAVNTSGVSLSASINTFNGAPDAGSGIAALNAISSTAGELGALVCMNGYVNRAAKNLAGELS